MGLDYVDIFYSHRVDPNTPLEETMGALDTAVRQGKALYVGISSYNAKRTARGGGDPPRPRHALPHPPAELFHAQPLDRGGQAPRHAGEGGHRLHLLLAAGAGTAQRQVSRRACPPTAAPASGSGAWRPGFLSEDNLAAIRGLNEIASEARPDARRDGDRLGAPRPARHLGADRREPAGADRRAPSAARQAPSFSAEELAEIDRHAKDAGVNLWRLSSAS